MSNIVKKEAFPKTQKELKQRKNIFYLLIPIFGGVGLYLVQSEVLGFYPSCALAILSFVFIIGKITFIQSEKWVPKIFQSLVCLF